MTTPTTPFVLSVAVQASILAQSALDVLPHLWPLLAVDAAARDLPDLAAPAQVEHDHTHHALRLVRRSSAAVVPRRVLSRPDHGHMGHARASSARGTRTVPGRLRSRKAGSGLGPHLRCRRARLEMRTTHGLAGGVGKMQVETTL